MVWAVHHEVKAVAYNRLLGLQILHNQLGYRAVSFRLCCRVRVLKKEVAGM